MGNEVVCVYGKQKEGSKWSKRKTNTQCKKVAEWETPIGKYCNKHYKALQSSKSVETEGNLISTKDPKKKTGFSKSTLVQTIYKDGIKELLESLEEQKKKHLDAKERGKAMLDAEVTALGMIEGDLKKIKDAIGDLNFKEEESVKPAEPTKPTESKSK